MFCLEQPCVCLHPSIVSPVGNKHPAAAVPLSGCRSKPSPCSFPSSLHTLVNESRNCIAPTSTSKRPQCDLCCRSDEGSAAVVSLPQLRREAQAAHALASWLPENLYSQALDAVKALHNAGAQSFPITGPTFITLPPPPSPHELVQPTP